MNLTQEQWIGIVAALVIVILFFGYTYIPGFFNNFNPNTMMTEESASNTPEDNVSQQLKAEDQIVGTGETAQPGDKVTVNYIGTFENGTKFDSSYDRGTPFTFTLGGGEVIAGWDLGVTGMKAGGKRILTVPPELGYGPNDYGPIPGNSTLLFEVELVKVEHPAPTQ